MDNRSWMYRDSPQWLYWEHHCKKFEGFINFALSYPKKINGGKIRCSCVKYKNKKFYRSNVVTIHLLKKSLLRNICDNLHTKNPMFLTRLF